MIKTPTNSSAVLEDTMMNVTNEPIREGYMRDWATGKVVDFRKPEEKVRQDYEKIWRLSLSSRQ